MPELGVAFKVGMLSSKMGMQWRVNLFFFVPVAAVVAHLIAVMPSLIFGKTFACVTGSVNLSAYLYVSCLREPGRLLGGEHKR